MQGSIAVAKEPAIIRRIGELVSTISALEDSVLTLENRLVFVSANYPLATDCGEQPANPECEMSAALGGLTTRVAAATEKIRQIMQKLEI